MPTVNIEKLIDINLWEEIIENLTHREYLQLSFDLTEKLKPKEFVEEIETVLKRDPDLKDALGDFLFQGKGKEIYKERWDSKKEREREV